MKPSLTLLLALAVFLSSSAVAQVAAGSPVDPTSGVVQLTTPATPIDPTLVILPVTPVDPTIVTPPVTPNDPANATAQSAAQAAAVVAQSAIQAGAAASVTQVVSTHSWIVLGRVPNQAAISVGQPATPAGGSSTNPTSHTYVSDGQYVNFSMRGTVAGTAQPLIAGFVVAAGQKVTLIRAIGPTLATFGVNGALANPRLELFDHYGQRIALALAWAGNSAEIKNQIKAATASTGAFPLADGSNDAVLLAVLEAGTYTCVVNAPDGSSGQVLLEAYDVPSAVIVP